MSSDELVVNLEIWNARREKFYTRMIRDLKTGYFDVEMYPLIKTLFKLEDAFPTSSCAGRLVILAAEMPWKKKDVTIIYKTHSVRGLKHAVLGALRSEYEDLWLTVQPPILHISCRNLSIASKLLEAARRSGFKHSGIISVSKRGIHLEIRGSEGFTFPIRINGEDIVKKSSLGMVVREAYKILREARVKIERLEGEVEKIVDGNSRKRILRSV